MSENYTAWDGNDYPWPPPDGWVMGSDGRYWPDGQQPAEQGATSVAAPPPTAPGSAPPPGFGPAAMPPPGPQAPGTYAYGPPPTKSSKAGWWILGIILVVMASGVGGCLLIASILANGADQLGETFSEFEDDFTRRQEAIQAIGVSSCSIDGGVPTATGTVTNTRNVRSSYFVQIEFFETATGSSLGTADVSFYDIKPGDSESWELSAPASGIEGAIKCERGFDAARIQD